MEKGLGKARPAASVVAEGALDLDNAGGRGKKQRTSLAAGRGRRAEG
jgi:hypothetical protein